MNRSRSSTRLLIIAAVLAVVAAGAIFAVLRIGNAVRGGDLSDTAALMPGTTTGVVAAKGFLDLALELRGSAPADDATHERFTREFKEVMGFDPSDVSGWRETGADFSRPWAVASLGRSLGAGEVLVLIPITDLDRAHATVKRLFEKAKEESKALTFEEVTLEGGQKAWAFRNASASADGAASTPFAFTERDGYLAGITGNGRSFDAQRALQDYLAHPAEQTLASEPDFKRALATLGSEWHLFAYGDDTLYRPFMAMVSGNTDDLKGFAAKGVALSVQYTDERVTTKLAILNTDESTLNTLLVRGKDGLGARIGGQALAAGRFSVDSDATWRLAKKVLQDRNVYDAVLQEAQAKGVDLEKDVARNLTGHVSFAIYEPQGPGLPVDAVVWAGVKDAAAFAKALDAVAVGFTRSGSDGQQWWNKDGMSLGVANEHLLFVTSDARRGDVSSGLSQANGSYRDGFPAPAKDALASGPSFFSYVDLERSRGVVDRTAGRDQGALLQGLTGASLSVDAQGSVVLVDLTVNAKKGALAKALQEAGKR